MWQFSSITGGVSAEKVLTGEAAFGSVYTLHRSRGLFRSAV
jgi:hypothetical protein